jgi:hypothetical protein
MAIRAMLHSKIDAMDRVWKASLPSTNGSFLYSENQYDSLGRVTEARNPDGTKTSRTYEPGAETVQDEAGIKRQLQQDALGRLVAVVENPGASDATTTNYAYDLNDELNVVCPQGGVVLGQACIFSDKSRSFDYDKLGRIVRAGNPETGNIFYTYDETDTGTSNGKGNLTRVQQIRGPVSSTVSAVTRHRYDTWNRLIGKNYSGSPNGLNTPDVSFVLYVDSNPISGLVNYPLGRLIAVSVAGGSAMKIDSYDAMGRVTRSRQTTNGVTYRFGTDTLAGYEYYFNGALAKMRYPTGRELSYTIDDLSRVTSLQGLKDGATSSYVNSASYTAFGGFDTLQLNGNRSRERYVYNPQRLQLQELHVERCVQADAACTGAASQLRLGYDYGVANNGNPREQRIETPGMAVKQSYLYDAWNRLKTFTESPLAGGAAAVTEEYCYDAHGNRALLSGPGVPAQTPQVSSCTAAEVTALFPNNRVIGLDYDAGGQLWRDFGRELRFDIEGRLRQSIPAGAGALTTNYAYDGEGRRVWMQTGTSSVRPDTSFTV